VKALVADDLRLEADWSAKHARFAASDEDRQPVALMLPELVVLLKISGWSEQLASLSWLKAALGEPALGFSKQVL
jgi:hypothetical protein